MIEINLKELAEKEGFVITNMGEQTNLNIRSENIMKQVLIKLLGKMEEELNKEPIDAFTISTLSDAIKNF